MTQPTSSAPPSAAPPVRPRRRLWKWLGGFLVVLILTPVLLYFGFGWWGDRQLQKITAKLDAEDPKWRWDDVLAEIKPPPDEKNSAIQLGKVAARLKAAPFKPGPKWDNADPLKHRNARISQDQMQALQDAFAAVGKETLAEARKLKDMPGGAFTLETDPNPFLTRMDHIQETREIVFLLSCDAVLRSQVGDLDGAAESCLAILNTAEALRDQPFLIGQLVRINEQATGVDRIEYLLGQGEMSEEHLEKLQRTLEAQLADDGLHRALRGERASSHQVYTNLREGKTTFSGLFGTMRMRTGFMEQVLDVFPGVVLGGYPDYLQLMNEQVNAAKLKDAERAEAFAKLEDKIRQSRRNLLIMMIMPAMSKVADATQRSQAQMRCTVAGLAAERYRLRHDGAWPRSLDDLVKNGLLQSVPIDPFDSKPLLLKRTPTGILIYSVGFDKTDNAGKLDRNNPRSPDTDLGFELFDRRGIPPILDRDEKN